MSKGASIEPASQSSHRELIAVGASHKTAPLEVLESLSFPQEEIKNLLPRVKERFALHEVLFLSTCNRSEIYAISDDGAGDPDGIGAYLLELANERTEMDGSHLYVHRGPDAVRHLFGVTCGLDAMVLGETEITGQVQTALTIADEAGTGGSYLVRLVSEAFRTSKRVRNETALGEGTTSVASVAVHMARRVFGDLSVAKILIVGAGETAELVSKHLKPDGPKKLVITNRTPLRAENLARKMGGETVPFGDWDDVLLETDVVVCATHSKVPLITKDMIIKAVGPSQSRVVLLIDISLPHNIDKSLADVDNVFLYDMEDLKAIVQKNLDRRGSEVERVRQIIYEEQSEFFRKEAALEIGPLIRDLRESFDDTRKKELDRFKSKFSDSDHKTAERLTRDLVNKLLHVPTLELRALGSEKGTNQDRLLWVRRLFGLRKE